MERLFGEDGPIMYREVRYVHMCIGWLVQFYFCYQYPVMDRALVVDGHAIFYARETSKYIRTYTCNSILDWCIRM